MAELPAFDEKLHVHELTGVLSWTGSPIATPLEAIYKVFVAQAPFQDERERLWDAYLLWDRMAAELIPDGQVFMDGSFLAYGDTAPRDIDVFLLSDSNAYRSLQLDHRRLLFNSIFENGLLKFKPFGMIDANWCDSGNPSAIEYWGRLWSSIRNEAGSISENMRKGYVEVMR